MSTADVKELKGGHPPAEIVGGMRVARPHRNSGSDKEISAAEKAADAEEFGTDVTPKGEKHTQSVTVSGATTREEKAFPADAVKQFHTKPIVAKEKRPVNTSHTIQQPR